MCLPLWGNEYGGRLSRERGRAFYCPAPAAQGDPLTAILTGSEARYTCEQNREKPLYGQDRKTVCAAHRFSALLW